MWKSKESILYKIALTIFIAIKYLNESHKKKVCSQKVCFIVPDRSNQNRKKNSDDDKKRAFDSSKMFSIQPFRTNVFIWDSVYPTRGVPGKGAHYVHSEKKPQRIQAIRSRTRFSY